MDIAYDHIQEEALSPSSPERKATTAVTESADHPNNSDSTATNIDTELRTAVKSFQSSQWGSTLGGWFNTARKQGEDFYIGLQQEAAEAQEEAKKSLMSLREQVVNRTRSLSLEFAGEGDGNAATTVADAQAIERSDVAPDSASNATAAAAEAEAYQGETSMDGLSSSDIVREAGTLVASLRLTAASKLKDLQRAEDAADEALLKFGANVRNFLKDAVTISAPDDATLGAEREVLFETQEAGTGKKVVHASRLEALLHAIHTNLSSFAQDPTGDHWNTWTSTFDIDSKTTDIASDLEKHIDLRRAMEKLVPESVDYRTFWMRYYFLRQAVEDDERRRKEVLKGATSTQEEEVAWDEESDDETSSTPNPTTPGAVNAAASVSTTTLNASSIETSATPQVTVTTESPRRSHEDEKRSIPDSDTSYDIVSGATSRAPGSEAGDGRKGEESDDDWE